MKRAHLALVLVLMFPDFFSRPAGLVTQDWPQWRGPSSLGVSTDSGLPTRWGPAENIAWQASLAGFGASSPIICLDKIFVTSQVGKAPVRAGSHPLLARDDQTLAERERIMSGARMPSTAAGGEVWRQRLGGIFFASPVAGDKKVYFVSETGETIVLRAGEKPEILARNDLGERFIASPAISKGRLFLRSDGKLFAVGK